MLQSPPGPQRPRLEGVQCSSPCFHERLRLPSTAISRLSPKPHLLSLSSPQMLASAPAPAVNQKAMTTAPVVKSKGKAPQKPNYDNHNAEVEEINKSIEALRKRLVCCYYLTFAQFPANLSSTFNIPTKPSSNRPLVLFSFVCLHLHVPIVHLYPNFIFEMPNLIRMLSRNLSPLSTTSRVPMAINVKNSVISSTISKRKEPISRRKEMSSLQSWTNSTSPLRRRFVGIWDWRDGQGIKEVVLTRFGGGVWYCD